MSTADITPRHQQCVQVTAEHLPNGRTLYAAIQDVRTSTSGALHLNSAGDLQAPNSSFEPETGAVGRHQQSSLDSEARGAVKRMRRRSDAGQVRICCTTAMPHDLLQAQLECLPAHSQKYMQRVLYSDRAPFHGARQFLEVQAGNMLKTLLGVLQQQGTRALKLHDRLTDALVSSQVFILPERVSPGMVCLMQEAAGVVGQQQQ